MRLGFYRALKNLKVLLRKKAKTQGLEAQKALKAGIVRMKHETLRSMLYHLKDYQENFKFKYLFKLVEAMVNVLSQATLDRFQAYFTDLGTIAQRINDNQVDKDKLAAILQEMERTAMGVKQRIERVRAEIK
jgi:alcohol dehydrogenase YqhD (iron-dependent ADH family)